MLAPDAKVIYIGTDDGHVIALDPRDGREKWRYATRGPVLESPVLSGDLLILSNEADQVYALDRATGKFRWQYKSETPEEFTLRGHAGVTVDGDLVFTGFSNGTLVALRVATGSVAWSLAQGDAERSSMSKRRRRRWGERVAAVGRRRVRRRAHTGRSVAHAEQGAARCDRGGALRAADDEASTPRLPGNVVGAGHARRRRAAVRG